MLEVTARLKIRAGELEGFKQQAAEMMRQTREKDTTPGLLDVVGPDGTNQRVPGPGIAGAVGTS